MITMTIISNVIMASLGEFNYEKNSKLFHCVHFPRNIIVRPQWLCRVANSPARFQARFSDNIDASSSSFTPLIVFINKLSGGQRGENIYRQLIRLLNPRQVFLLENNASINYALDIYSSLGNTRICICGGDGSVGWILTVLAERFQSLNNPPVSICPLGTGNDLSRVLGWGWHYDASRLRTIILQISTAKPIVLDRWQIALQPMAKIEHRIKIIERLSTSVLLTTLVWD
jgi:hypothetical protein